MGENAIAITDDSFDKDVINSDLPVLVDFWAPWCGPCRAVAPVVEDLAQQYAGKIKVTKLNVDDNPKTAGAYGIRAIPSLLFFKQGKLAEQITGAVGKVQLEEAIKKLI